IVWADGAPLFMGALFDDATALANTDYYEAAAAGRDFSFSAEEARANRRLLYWVMTEVGFVNHPDEFWHFSWVDQAWAKVTGTATGFFGLATLSEGMG
ncbi:MAG: M15 family metallopeptidase, partial [Hyphomonadaceae bacterium]